MNLNSEHHLTLHPESQVSLAPAATASSFAVQSLSTWSAHARAVVSAKSSSQRQLGSATRVRGVAVPKTSARLSTRGAANGRGALKVVANGLPPNLAGMMGNMDPEKMKEIQEAYAKAMKDPETAKKVNDQMSQMSGMMNNPMVQKQMAAMNNMISVRLFPIQRASDSTKIG